MPIYSKYCLPHTKIQARSLIYGFKVDNSICMSELVSDGFYENLCKPLGGNTEEQTVRVSLLSLIPLCPRVYLLVVERWGDGIKENVTFPIMFIFVMENF